MGDGFDKNHVYMLPVQPRVYVCVCDVYNAGVAWLVVRKNS